MTQGGKVMGMIRGSERVCWRASCREAEHHAELPPRNLTKSDERVNAYWCVNTLATWEACKIGSYAEFAHDLRPRGP